MAPLATSTTSTESSGRGPCLRKTSLKSLFARFLSTAPPTFRLATKPTRSKPSFETRTKATKSGFTHRRPSRYTRSKSARPRRLRGRPRGRSDPASIKPKDGAAPCAGAERAPPDRPSSASSRGSRGCGCVGVDSAGMFFSFRHDSRFTAARAPSRIALPSLNAVEAKSTMLLRGIHSVNPSSAPAPRAPLPPRIRPIRIFSCRPIPHMLDYAPRPVDKDEALFIEVGPSHCGFSTFVDISVENACRPAPAFSGSASRRSQLSLCGAGNYAHEPLGRDSSEDRDEGQPP